MLRLVQCDLLCIICCFNVLVHGRLYNTYLCITFVVYIQLHPAPNLALNPALNPNLFFNPNLLNRNWDDIIVISDDEEDDEDTPTSIVENQVLVFGQKTIYSLIDESN